jgi:LmbE family N-acetylglucosaminyl deacetylase
MRLTDVVVSPHFDDAVLSAASVLREHTATVLVLTVCGGVPAGGGDDEWDRLCGFESGAAAARGRAAEDLAAAAVVGHRTMHLPIPDGPYRIGFPADQVVSALSTVLEPGVRVWAPAGIGSHPDHVGARDAAVTAAAGHPLIFYADCPYAFIGGWDAADEARPPDHRWTPALDAIADLVDPHQSRIVRLDDDAMRAKIAMVRCHASQLAGMAEDHPHFVAWDGPLRRETFWPARAGM